MDAPNILMERNTAGLRVELRYIGETKVTGIWVTLGEKFNWTPVEPEHVLDAFHHPYCYIPQGVLDSE